MYATSRASALLPSPRSVFLSFFEIAVELFDQSVDLRRIAFCVLRRSQIAALLTWIPAHSNFIRLLVPYYSSNAECANARESG